MWFFIAAAIAIVVVYLLKKRNDNETMIMVYHSLFVPDDIANYCSKTGQVELLAKAVSIKVLATEVLEKYPTLKKISIEDTATLLDLNMEMRRLFELAGMGGRPISIHDISLRRHRLGPRRRNAESAAPVGAPGAPPISGSARLPR